MNTDLHRRAPTAGSAFATTEKRRATVVNGSTETDWQRKTAKALIIEAVLENGLAGSAIHHMRLWFFPLRSVSVGPFNSVAKAFPLFRLIVVFPACATTKNIGHRS